MTEPHAALEGECGTRSAGPGTGRIGRTTAVSVAATVVVAIPVMLVGALSVLIREDIPFGEARLGLGVSVHFLVAGVASIIGGRAAERFRPRSTVRVGLAVSIVSLLVTALIASTWWHVVVALGLAGLATGVVHPAVNLVLAREIRPGLQGVLFGAKQAAVPAAALLAGFAVPAMASLGWRWAFALMALAASCLIVVVPKWEYRRVVMTDAADGLAPIPTGLVLLAGAGGALASGSANAMSIFLVLFVTSIGLSLDFAAGFLILGSVSAILSRLGAGLLAGRLVRGHFLLVGCMMTGGALGYMLLSVARSPVVLAVGVVIGFAAGWGWPGVMLLGVVRASPSAPATASGITQGATFFGAVAGPAAFGGIASSMSYDAAWRSMSIAAVVGATLLLAASRMSHRPGRARDIAHGGVDPDSGHKGAA